MILSITMAAILLCMAFLIFRALRSDTIFDRILVISSFGTKTVLMIAVLGFLEGRPDFLDLALVYALMNFIATIAVLRFTHYGDLMVLDKAADSTEPALPEPTSEPGWGDGRAVREAP